MSQIRILIVEDDEVTALSLKKKLNILGYEVTDAVKTGEDALISTEKTKPDLVLMDIMLEGQMDGIESANIISDEHNVPILFITAYSHKDFLERASSSEAMAYIMKPFKIEELEANICISIAKHKINQEIKKTKQYYSSVLHNIKEAILTTDSSGIVQFANPQASSILEADLETLTGKHIDEVMNVRASRGLIIQDSNSYDFNYKPSSAEKRKLRLTDNWDGVKHKVFLFTGTGKEIPVSLSKSYLKDDKNVVIGLVISFSDISQKQRVEEELSKIQRIDSLGVLAGGIAHDFNNILTAILGNVSIALLNSKKGDKVFKRLEEAEIAISEAKDLTNQLLNFSKGGAPVKLVTSLKKLIFDTCSFTVRGSNVFCDFMVSDDLLPAEIDTVQISQVLSSIVLNAKQAMPQGGRILVKAENYSIGEDNDLPVEPGVYIRISIIDSGIGIQEDFLSRIFYPFFSTKHQGSGLGLSNAFNIMKKHQGYITVSSELGKGSRFNIFIPSVQESILKEIHEEEDNALDIKGNVLIMDDEEEVRKVSANIFKTLGFTVQTAKNGEEALEIFKQAYTSGKEDDNEKFKIVVLDLTVSKGLGGVQVLNDILDVDPNVITIVCSGYINDDVITNYEKYGFSAALKKPFKINDVINVVKRLRFKYGHGE